mgnify:CR=1 FL=1
MAPTLGSPLGGSISSGFGGKKSVKSKLVIGILVVVLIPFLFSTYAANVTVGNGPLEFGQGSQQAIACDPTVYVAMAEEWYSSPQTNDPSAGFFRVKSVTISNLDLNSCKNKKLRVRLIDLTGKEIMLGNLPDAKVLQVTVPNVDQQVSVNDPIALKLTYLNGDGAPITGTMAATAAINTSGLSVYDGSDLSASSSDVTFYLDSSRQVNIDGQTVGRTTVETVNNPSV